MSPIILDSRNSGSMHHAEIHFRGPSYWPIFLGEQVAILRARAKSSNETFTI